MTIRPVLFAAAPALAVFLLAGGAAAGSFALARASGGQPALAVGFDPSGKLLARVCTQLDCEPSGGEILETPPDVSARATAARLTVAPVGLERHAVVVEVGPSAAGPGWAALVVAPLSGGHPTVLFSGRTGPVEGIEGERKGSEIVLREGAVYVAQEQEDRTLCGRPAILAPRAVNPRTLRLEPAKLQRLLPEARAAAVSIVAQRSSGAAPAPLPILKPVWATSAAPEHPVLALTDGDPATSWAENRGGVGRGELVVLTASRELPLHAFEITLPRDDAAHAALPSELFLATEHDVFRVVLPGKAARGERFTVSLPGPLHAGCVALVLESATPESRDAVVGIAELSAQATLEAKPAELVRKLSGGGQEADAAGELLRALGRDAAAEIVAHFGELTDEGRRVALGVLDDAPCEVAMPALIEALASGSESQVPHARASIARCGPEGPRALAVAVGKAAGARRLTLVEELVEESKAEAARAVIALFAGATAEERRSLRAVLARCAASPEAMGVISGALVDEGTKAATVLDLLRALGQRLPELGTPAERAFSRLVAESKTERGRFLLVGPAAALARSDPAAREYVRDALQHGRSPMIRTEAARAAADQDLFQAELTQALTDPNVRVREAAAGALGAARVRAAGPGLSRVLEEDRWPLVRVAAARAMGRLPAEPALDAALTEALADPAADVRRAVITALGARHAAVSAGKLREVLDDGEELGAVRAAAAGALGAVCDRGALDALTRYAHRLGTGKADISDYLIGQSALGALAALGPADLQARLRPLLGKEIRGPVRQLALRALSAPGRCGSRGPVRR